MSQHAPGGDDPGETIARRRFDAPQGPGTAFRVEVIEGPDTGKSFRLDGSQPAPVLVGQGPACEVRLSDREVSRRHASLELSGRRLRIRDLDSTNGTFVDGLAIVEALLMGDEVMRIGRTALQVHAEQGAAVDTPAAANAFGKLLGTSPEMRKLYPLCQRLASSDVPVIIEGETGTGKEVLAEALHEQGARASGPFVVFDCTAVAPSLLESELFGHEKGAFTGAVGARKGMFEQADGGTLLIDEIGDLDLAMQPKLLRVIERSELRRLGGDRPVRVDVRIIAATRRDLDRAVQTGRFRDDLFHRLAVGRIELPPLRRRQGDVTGLARHFARQMGGAKARIPDDILLGWEEYNWPGNVRELRNAVARYLALGDRAQLESGTSEAAAAPAPKRPTETAASEDLIEQVIASGLPLTMARQKVVEEFERRYIERVLAAHGGNVVRAAAASGIARRYFQILKARQGK